MRYITEPCFSLNYVTYSGIRSGLIIFAALFIFMLVGQFAKGQEIWSDGDIGAVGMAGTGSYNSSTDTFTVAGAGAGVGSSADACNLISVPASGNLELIAHVGSLQNISNYSTAGLMMRESTAAGAVNAFVNVSPGNGVSFTTRSSTGALSVTAIGGLGTSVTAPVWLRLVRSATTVSQDGQPASGYSALAGYYSSDGTNWTLIGNQTIQMANSVVMGLAVSSSTASATATATFDHVSVLTNVPQRASNLVAWYRADAGVVQNSGSVASWQDQSGNGNTLAQTGTSLEPSFTANSLNGCPVVHFTHASNSYLSVLSNSTLNPAQTTIFVVTRNTGTSAGRLVDKLSGSAGYSLRFSTSTAPSFYINTGSITGTLSPTNTWALLEGEYNSSYNESLYVNGALASGTGSAVISGSTQALSVGGLATTGNTADADIAEILVFNSALSTGASDNIEAYFYQKYGMGVEPVAFSPIFSSSTGIYGSSQTVTLTPGTPGDIIYYTTDGSTPTTSSTVYASPIAISSTGTLNAIETSSGFANSPVVSATYTIDSTTANVPHGNLAGWFRADTGVILNGSTVSQWSDQSGNGNNAIQTTGTKQPAVVSNAIGTDPAVQFNSAAGTYLSIANNSTLNGSGVTVFAVVKKTNSSNTGYLVAKAVSSTYPYKLILNGTLPELFINTGSVTPTGTLTNNTFGVMEGEYDQTSARLYLNGGLQASSAYTTALLATNTDPVGIGGQSSGNYLDGDIAEVLVYNAGLGAAQRQQVEAYLYARYGLASTYPASSPTISPASGIYSSSQTVALTQGRSGDTIYYTTDGSTPTTSSTAYTGSITFSSTGTLNAIETSAGFANSPVVSATYTIDSTTANVVHSGLVGWFRADAGVVLNGSTVSQWTDLSGNGNNAVQATTSEQPAVAINAIGTHPALLFNSAASTYLSIPNNSTLNGSQLTIFTVVKKTNSSNTGYLVAKEVSSTNPYQMKISGTTPQLYVNSNASSVTGTLTSSTFGLVEGEYDQTSLRIYLNGNLQASAACTTALVTTNTDPVGIGGQSSGSYLDGDIAEVLIYNTGLSTAQREQVEAYLYLRYGLGTSPVALSPIPSESTGIYGSAQSITLTPGIAGDTIYYTTDGSTPTTSSTAYTVPIAFSSTGTLNAIEASTSFSSSPVVSATYTIDSATANVLHSNLVSWFRADTGVVLNGSTVSQWTDESGNGNNAMQVTSSKQPVVVSNAIGTEPALQFNSTASTYLSVPNNSTLTGNQVTMFTVVKKTNSSNEGYYVAKSVSAAFAYSLRINGVQPQFLINSEAVYVTGTLTNNTFGLVEGEYDQTSARIYLNGSLQASTAYTTALISTDTDPLGIGGQSNGSCLDGDIAEVLVYNTGLTTTQREKVEAYLQLRYGLGSAPAASSPTISTGSGIYGSSQSVTLALGTPGDTIYYTTDGSTPTTSSTVYAGSITFSSTGTLNAIEASSGFANSPVVSATYTIDSTTASVPHSGLVGWFRADTGVVLSGSTVSQWSDQSGNGDNAIQATGTKQPTVVSNAIGTEPALQFNSTAGTYLSIANTGTLNGSQATVFAVVKKTNSSNTGYLVAKAVSSTYPYKMIISGTQPNWFINSGAVDVTGTLTNSTFGVVEGEYDQTSARLYLNGGLQASSAYTTALVTTNTDPVGIGGQSSGNYLDGDIAELLVYNTGLSTAQRQQVEAYLYGRYGLASASMAASPVISTGSGIYSSSQTVTLTPGRSGDAVYYTTDGSTPTTSSTAYTGSITFSSTGTLNAIEASAGFSNSSVVSAVYTIDSTTANVVHSGLVGWFRADTGVILNGSTVSQWTDESGNGNNAVQATSSKQPIVVSNAIGTEPALQFNSAASTYLSVPNNSTLTGSQVTMFTVVKKTNSSNEGYYVAKSVSAAFAYSLRINGVQPQFLINSEAVYVTGTLTNNTFGLVEGEYDQTSARIYLNGNLQASTAYTTALINTNTDPLGIGGQSNGSCLDGDIAEVLVYNTGLSDESRLSVESYLAARYNLLASTPSAPTFSVATGTLSAPEQVALAAPTGATIYYTLNGGTPTTSSTVYSGPIYVDYTETINAIAYENGLPISSVSAATYTLNSTLWPAPTTGTTTPPTITLQLPTNATLLP